MTDTTYDAGADVQEASVSAYATSPSSATGEITEHVVTDENGNEVETEATEGREFYTIETASDKVFYLIVDRSSSGDGTAYFLTEVSENDLLNTVDTSGIEADDSADIEAALTGDDSKEEEGESADASQSTEEGQVEEASSDSTEDTTEATTESILSSISPETYGSWVTYGICGVVIAVILVVGILIKKKKARENFIDDDEEEEESFEEYDDDDEELESDSDEDFLNNNTEDEEE